MEISTPHVKKMHDFHVQGTGSAIKFPFSLLSAGFYIPIRLNVFFYQGLTSRNMGYVCAGPAVLTVMYVYVCYVRREAKLGEIDSDCLVGAFEEGVVDDGSCFALMYNVKKEAVTPVRSFSI